MTTAPRNRQPSQDQEVVDLGAIALETSAHRLTRRSDVAPVELDASAQRLELLRDLVQSMGATLPLERPALASRINEVVIAMRAPGHEAEESELLLELLRTKVLNDQLDAEGRSCRKEIVETLMACGFPHALQLEPDDVRYLRNWRDQQPVEADDDELAPWELAMRTDRNRGGLVMVAGQALALAFGFRVLLNLPSLSAMLGVGATWLAGAIAGTVLAMLRPRDLNIAVYGALVTMLGLIGVGVAMAVGDWHFALAPAGLMLGLFASLMRMFEPRADPRKPGDWDYTDDGTTNWWFFDV